MYSAAHFHNENMTKVIPSLPRNPHKKPAKHNNAAFKTALRASTTSLHNKVCLPSNANVYSLTSHMTSRVFCFAICLSCTATATAPSRTLDALTQSTITLTPRPLPALTQDPRRLNAAASRCQGTVKFANVFSGRQDSFNTRPCHLLNSTLSNARLTLFYTPSTTRQTNNKTNSLIIAQGRGGTNQFRCAVDRPTRSLTAFIHTSESVVHGPYLIHHLVAADLKGLDPLRGIVRQHLAHNIQRLFLQHNPRQSRPK